MKIKSYSVASSYKDIQYLVASTGSPGLVVDSEDMISQNLEVWQTYLRNLRRGEYGYENWIGAPSVDKAIQILNSSWIKGIERVKLIEEKIRMETSHPKFTRRVKTRSNLGNELDIHAINSGSFSRAWSRTKKIQHKFGKLKTKKVVIVYQYGGNNRYTSDQLFYSAVAGLLMSRKLNQVGFSTRIIGVNYSIMLFKRNPNLSVFFETMLKDFGNRINLNEVAMACFAGFFRISCFNLRCKLPYPIRKAFGRTMPFPKSDIGNHYLRRIEKQGYKVIMIPTGMTTLKSITNYLENFKVDAELNQNTMSKSGA